MKESTLLNAGLVKISFLTFATNLYSVVVFQACGSISGLELVLPTLPGAGVQAHWDTGTLGPNLTVEEGDEGLGH